ncbi:unnamed protein product [Closterium sp. NIES-65]|nr:unnamed protein product [Closterium sp. NIES-65]
MLHVVTRRKGKSHQSLYIFPGRLPLSRFAYPLSCRHPFSRRPPLSRHPPLSRRLSYLPPPSLSRRLPRSLSRHLRALSPVAFELSLPTTLRSHSRRFRALPPVAFALSYPSPPRSLSRHLRALPPVAFALSFSSPSRSHSRRLRALTPVASALSFPLPPHSLSRRLRALSLPRPSFFLYPLPSCRFPSHSSPPDVFPLSPKSPISSLTSLPKPNILPSPSLSTLPPPVSLALSPSSRHP